MLFMQAILRVSSHRLRGDVLNASHNLFTRIHTDSYYCFIKLSATPVPSSGRNCALNRSTHVSLPQHPADVMVSRIVASAHQHSSTASTLVNFLCYSAPRAFEDEVLLKMTASLRIRTLSLTHKLSDSVSTTPWGR